MGHDPDLVEDDDQADADLVDPTVNCEGTFDRDFGRCTLSHHTHCPWCWEIHDCPHFLAGWNDDVGYYSIKPPRLYDDTVADLLVGDWQAKAPADLHRVLRIYEVDGSHVELLDEALTVACIEAVCQHWEMLDRMPAGFGYAWYIPDAATARMALQGVWQRIEVAFAG